MPTQNIIEGNKITNSLVHYCKCNTDEAIPYIIKDLGDSIEFTVKKCNNCKYQYGIKEIETALKNYYYLMFFYL